MTALHRARMADAATIDAFLSGHGPTSMFLRSNLARFGTDDTDNPHGTAFYLSEQDGALTGVFASTNSGYLMAQAPVASPEDWAAFANVLHGKTVQGMTGVPDQVQACLRACGLGDGPWQLLADEPLYHIRLSDLPELPAIVRTPTAADVPMLEEWFTAYETDTGFAPASDGPTESGRTRAAAAVNAEHIVLLEEDGAPVAMAAVNARAADVVQIGGVFTPDDLRGQGFARRAVAGLLCRCAERDGATQSVLFANNDAAAHAYEALGYRLIGQYRVALLATPTRIGDTG